MGVPRIRIRALLFGVDIFLKPPDGFGRANSLSNHGPEPLKVANKAIGLHTSGEQVLPWGSE